MSRASLAAFLLLAAAAFVGCSRAPETSAAGEFTREAAWIDLQGYRERLAAEKGRVVVVNFWATWCEPCREEFPDLVRFHQRTAGRGVTFLSISLDSPREREAAVRQFLAEQRPGFPVFVKTDKDDPDAFINGVDPGWSGVLPATFIYDRSGERRQAFYGPQTLRELENYVRPLL